VGLISAAYGFAKGASIGVFLFPLLTGLLGFVFGLAAGVGIERLTRLKMPVGIKRAEDAKKYPSVRKMLENGWKFANVPSEPEGAEFAELSEEGEREFGVLDDL
jgi:hypothetical protein